VSDGNPQEKPVSREKRLAWLTAGDDALLSDCVREDLSGGGAGGQKRDRKYSGVRVRHLPSGVVVGSPLSRSRARNESDAIAKLRLALALEVRCPPPPELGPISDEVSAAKRLPLALLADVFDVLESYGFRIGDAARALGISTSSLLKPLARDKTVWRKLNEKRVAEGLKTLSEP